MVDDEKTREPLLAEYSEVCSNFRALTDIRFKLIGLLPIAAVAGALFATGPQATLSLGVSLFGLVATLAIATYNERNNQLYDDLVARAAEIERDLGVTDGAFANRPGPWLSIPIARLNWTLDHRWALALVYFASTAIWLLSVLSSGLALAHATLSPLPHSPLERWWDLLLLLVSIAVVGYATHRILETKKRRGKALDNLLQEVTDKAMRKSWVELAEDEAFQKSCAEVAEPNITKRCDAQGRIRKRIHFFKSLSLEDLRHYMKLDPPSVKAAYVIALLCDMSYVSVLKRYRDDPSKLIDAGRLTPR